MSNRIQRRSRATRSSSTSATTSTSCRTRPRSGATSAAPTTTSARFADYPGGDVNAAPAGLYRTGVTTRLNRLHRPLREAARRTPASRSRTSTSRRRFRSARRTPSAAVPGGRARRRPSPLSSVPPARAVPASRSTSPARRRPRTTPSRTRMPSRPTRSSTSFINGSRCPFTTAPAGPGVAVYDSQALAGAATMIGGTKVTVDYEASTADGGPAERAPLRRVPGRHAGDGRPRPVPRRAGDRPGRPSSCTATAGASSPATSIRIEIAQDDAQFLKASEVPSTITINGCEAAHPGARAAAAGARGLQERLRVLQGRARVPRARRRSGQKYGSPTGAAGRPCAACWRQLPAASARGR